ncbi:MAG: hydrogenase nickel incorporation protein HypB [Cyclobacteriaceae bacterium]
MCATCGCDDHDVSEQQMEHNHSKLSREIVVEREILHANNLIAERNRGFFEAKGIHCINLVSSPGSGKTTLLEKSIKVLRDQEIYVIEGDQYSSHDADRIAKTKIPVLQINTGNGCHLDAEMIHKAIHKLKPTEGSVLIIENVGNLVCPALFDLGEASRVILMSVTEGEDKPVKYSNMFASADLCVFNKIDLLPYLDFDLNKAKQYAHTVNPRLSFMEVSATKGTNIQQWCDWLEGHVQAIQH